jgi:hypothetical protein
MPFSGGGKALFASGHFGILLKKNLIIILIVHNLFSITPGYGYSTEPVPRRRCIRFPGAHLPAWDEAV